jgi:hypothetical protein
VLCKALQNGNSFFNQEKLTRDTCCAMTYLHRHAFL